MWSTERSYALLWALAFIGHAEATYWINQIDSYDSLPVCAEAPLSSIVRDMVSGCGDGGRATSYSCFCTRSSKKFEGIISTAVSAECKHSGTEVASATSLFNAYCQLGNSGSTTATQVTVDASSTAEASSTETTASSTATSSPASKTATSDKQAANTSPVSSSSAESSLSTSTSLSSTESSVDSSSSSTATTAPESSFTTLSTGSKVAIGVCVPVSLIAVSAMIFMLLRRRRRHETVSDRIMLESRDGNQQFSAELAGGHYIPRAFEKAELDGRSASVDGPGTPTVRKYELP